MSIELRVDDRVRVPWAALPEGARERLTRACAHANPEWAKKRAMGYATYNVPAVIRTWRREGDALTLPRGAMSRVRAILREEGVAFRVVDERERGAPMLFDLEYVGPPPRGYQLAAARRCMAVEQGIVRASTGSGKTLTALYVSAQLGVNTLIVVPSVKLMEQTIESAMRFLGLREEDVGVVRGGERRLRPVTVASQKTLWARTVDEELDGFFGAVIGDEIHHAAARTFQETFDAFSARYRLGFSADERRKDKKEFLVYDAFGGIIHETSREECEETGAIVDVEVRIVFSDHDAPWYREESDFNRLVDGLTRDEERNELIVAVAREELEAGEKVIVCTHRREHARVIDAALVAHGARSGCMLGGADGADERAFEATRLGLRDGSVQAGVGTYEALGEGIDLPAVAVGIAATPITSNKQRFNQFRGRLCRPSAGKRQGRLYVIFDRRVFDHRALANILAWNRTVKVKKGSRWVDAHQLDRRAIIAA